MDEELHISASIMIGNREVAIPLGSQVDVVGDLNIKLRGQLTVDNVCELEHTLNRVRATAFNVILNGITYIDEASIGVLITIRKLAATRGQIIHYLNLSGAVERTARSTHFHEELIK